MESGDIALKLLTFLLVAGVAFALLTLVASFIRFHMLTHRLKNTDLEEVDPEDLFRLRIADELGILHQAPAPFAVLLVQPAQIEAVQQSKGEEAADAFVDTLTETIRKNVRTGDTVLRFEAHAIGILGILNRDQVEKLAQRLMEEIGQKPLELPSGEKQTIPLAIGAATYPDNGDRVASLLEAAQAALKEALPSATNQFCLHGPPAPENFELKKEAEKAVTKTQTRSGILDELTGVLRGDKLGTAMQKFVARHRKEEHPSSALFISIDYFKQYEDHYSKQATDLIVKGLADRLHEQTRETDIIARYKESEFVVVMDCTPNAALDAAQRLAADIKRTPFYAGGTPLKITVSIGVAGYPDHTGQAHQMLEFAENAMFAAQARGRNRCLLYDTSMRPRQDTQGPVDTI